MGSGQVGCAKHLLRSFSLRWTGQRKADNVVGILVKSRLAPAQKFDVSIRINVVGAVRVTVVSDPSLAAIIAAAPLHESRLAAPGVVVVLVDASVFGVVRRVERFGITLREHDEVAVWQTGKDGVGREAGENALDGVARGFVGEDGVQQLAFDGQAPGLGNGLL